MRRNLQEFVNRLVLRGCALWNILWRQSYARFRLERIKGLYRREAILVSMTPHSAISTLETWVGSVLEHVSRRDLLTSLSVLRCCNGGRCTKVNGQVLGPEILSGTCRSPDTTRFIRPCRGLNNPPMKHVRRNVNTKSLPLPLSNTFTRRPGCNASHQGARSICWNSR